MTHLKVVGIGLALSRKTAPTNSLSHRNSLIAVCRISRFTGHRVRKFGAHFCILCLL